MTKPKPPNAGMGGIKGVPNKATLNARRAIAAYVKNNEERLNRLLDQIEKREGPRAAWECMMRLIEHHMPKLRPSTDLRKPAILIPNCKSSEE